VVILQSLALPLRLAANILTNILHSYSKKPAKPVTQDAQVFNEDISVRLGNTARGNFYKNPGGGQPTGVYQRGNCFEGRTKIDVGNAKEGNFYREGDSGVGSYVKQDGNKFVTKLNIKEGDAVQVNKYTHGGASGGTLIQGGSKYTGSITFEKGNVIQGNVALVHGDSLDDF